MRARTSVQSSFMLLLLACLMALPGCNDRRQNNFSMTRGVSSTSSGGWEFSSGCVVMRPRQPGVVMGTQKAPGRSRELAYLILFRNNARHNAQPEVSNDSDVRISDDSIIFTYGHLLDGRLLHLVMELEKNVANNSLKTKTLTVNGKAYDPEQGRVFLLDESAASGGCVQVKAELPTEIPSLTGTGAAEQVVRQTLQKLSSDNKLVRDFVEEG